MRVALICIDLQQGYFREELALARRDALVERVNGLAQAFARAGHPVVVVGTEHAPDGSTFSLRMRRNGTSVMLAGSDDVADLGGLSWPAGSPRVTKTRYSAYLRTPLPDLLRDLGVTHAVHCGAFVDGCVGLSAIEAAERDFESFIAADASISCDSDKAADLVRFAQSEFEVRTAPGEHIVAMLAAGGGTEAVTAA